MPNITRKLRYTVGINSSIKTILALGIIFVLAANIEAVFATSAPTITGSDGTIHPTTLGKIETENVVQVNQGKDLVIVGDVNTVKVKPLGGLVRELQKVSNNQFSINSLATGIYYLTVDGKNNAILIIIPPEDPKVVKEETKIVIKDN